MKWLGNFYQWFWFHTEFWLTPVNRRPYTFIMRDWIYNNIPMFLTFLIVWYSGVFTLCATGHGLAATLCGTISSFILAHLIWGSSWIEGQQEFPTYLGGEDDTNKYD